MKEIKLEKTTILMSKLKFVEPTKDHECTYMDLIDVALDVVPQGGFTTNDIREINKLQKAIDKASKTTLKLEDAEFETLKTYIEKSRWMTRDKQLNKFLSIFD